MLVEIPFSEVADDDKAYHGHQRIEVALTGEQRLALHRVRAAMIAAGDTPLFRGNVLAEIIQVVAEAAEE